MGISRSESGEFSFRFWGFSIDKTQGEINCHLSSKKLCVNALSGLYLISTKKERFWGCRKVNVSMPFRAYTSFLQMPYRGRSQLMGWSVNALSGLYLISTNNECSHHSGEAIWGVNALSGLYLISTVPLQKPRFYAVSRACFCRYLSEYSDNNRFSCLLTFWTYLMRCTYPWHWIKYSTNYNRCHPIFSLSW